LEVALVGVALTLALGGAPSPKTPRETTDCFDAVVLGRVVRQHFAHVPHKVSPDTVFGPAPSVADVEMRRVIRGSVSARSLKVHSTVGEYFRTDRLFTMHLRRNAVGEFNWIFPGEFEQLRRCRPGEPPAEPYVPGHVPPSE
jgi:hypothetical protein